jgi:hypothetical protein
MPNASIQVRAKHKNSPQINHADMTAHHNDTIPPASFFEKIFMHREITAASMA